MHEVKKADDLYTFTVKGILKNRKNKNMKACSKEFKGKYVKMRRLHDKAKPAVRRGRKAMGLSRRGRDRQVAKAGEGWTTIGVHFLADLFPPSFSARACSYGLLRTESLHFYDKIN